MTQVVEILPDVRQELTYSTQSMMLNIMGADAWQRREPRLQQPWYWLCWIGIIRSLHIKV